MSDEEIHTNDEEGTWQGFDWTEVEAGVASDSAALDLTDEHRVNVENSRARWVSTGPNPEHITLTGVGIQPAGAEMSDGQLSLTLTDAGIQLAGGEMRGMNPFEVLTGVNPQSMDAEGPAPKPEAPQPIVIPTGGRPKPSAPIGRRPQPATPTGGRPQPAAPTREPVNNPQGTQNNSNGSGPAQRKDDGPNLWQRYMPSILGGWSRDKVDAWDNAHPSDEGPNLWQRCMPIEFGGWSRDKVEAWDRAHPSNKAPNLWQRYMPIEFGGWSREKVEAWDKAHPKAATQGKPQTEAATPKGGDGREVFRGVTVSELREAGYTNEQIQRMDMMATRAQRRSGGLIETLGAAAQANITREDYIRSGFNDQDIATIYKLSQNNR